MFLFLLLLPAIHSFQLAIHPVENKIAYISGITNVESVSKQTLSALREVYNQHPVLIFKDVNTPTPKSFIQFISSFDEYADLDAIKSPDRYPHQLLQPFDQFPDCKHVSPRGNFFIDEWAGIKNIKVEPLEKFVNNYVWHTDLLGHENKLPGCVTGFYFVEAPMIGGDTDFISGERVYHSLSEKEKEEACNTIIQYNRHRFGFSQVPNSYEGVPDITGYTKELDKYNTYSPLVFAIGENYSPSILFSPSFCSGIVGKSQDEAQQWIRNLVHNKMLHHRVSISWKKGDLALFNNRLFIHSSTPTRNYMDFPESSKRLLLQTFIPTNKPLYGLKPTLLTHTMNRFISVTDYWNRFRSDLSDEKRNHNFYVVAAKIDPSKIHASDPNPYKPN